MWLAVGWLGCMDTSLQSIPAPEVVVDTGETEPDAAPGAPVADAGADEEISPLDTHTLDAGGSHDPAGGRIVAWNWALVSRPSGSTTELDDPGAERPSFFADLAGDYHFALTVKNAAGVWDETPDDVTITAAPLDGFYVELSWDAATDLDLHLAEDGGSLFSASDCSYCNMTPDFGGPGGQDDASLDWDAIDGWGPETITIDAPASGEYTVRVHFYGENGSPSCPGGCPDTIATVRVFLGGEEVQSFRQKMAGQGSVWDVAAIEWPSGRIRELRGLGRTPETGCW